MAGSKIRLYGSTSGYVELEAPAVAPDGVLTLPTGTGGFGKTLQVVQTVKTDTFSASVASGNVSADVVSVSITPSSASNKVLVTGTISVSSTTERVFLQLIRGGSLVTDYVGDAAGVRQQGFASGYKENNRAITEVGFSFLDSPATTSSTVYSVRIGHASGLTQTVYVNRGEEDTDIINNFRTTSSITAIEVAA